MKRRPLKAYVKPHLMGLGLFTLGCGAVSAGLDTESGGDDVRDRAKAVFVGRTMTDSIDGLEGDNTDWKYIDVTDVGKVRFQVSLDTPERLTNGEVTFHDEFGGRLERLPIQSDTTTYDFVTEADKVPAKYYVRVFADAGKSVYSVGSAVTPSRPPVEPEPLARAPEPEPEPIEEPRPRRQARRATPAPVKPVAAKLTPAPTPPPAADGLSGRVIRVTPSEDNTFVTVTIRLDGEGSVSSGQQGRIFRAGSELPARFKVQKVAGRTVTGRVDLPQGKFTGSLSVKFP